MLDYELPASQARDRNLNLFMRFCGISYQVVCLLIYPCIQLYDPAYPGPIRHIDFSSDRKLKLTMLEPPHVPVFSAYR